MNTYQAAMEQACLRPAPEVACNKPEPPPPIAQALNRVSSMVHELQDTAGRVIGRFSDVVVCFPLEGEEATPPHATEPATSSMTNHLRGVEAVLARINRNLNSLIDACEL